jgi:hypothetical protein
MKIISSFLNCIFSITLFCIPLLSPSKTVAGDISINITQSILPVRFVYLNDKQQIINIWNNVTKKDKNYIIKFFINNREVKTDDNLMNIYIRFTSSIDKNYANSSPIIDVIKSNNSYEEIYTYI